MMGLRYCLTIALLLVGALVSSSARAACRISSTTPASLGLVTSFKIQNEPQTTSTTDSGLKCSGALLALFSTSDFIEATISSEKNSKLTAANGDQISYKIYADPSYTVELSPGTKYNYLSGQVLNLLGIFGGAEKSLPMYFRTTTGGVVRAGRYKDTLTITWNTSICTGIGLGDICFGRDNKSGQSSFDITVDVTNDCVISAPIIDLGKAPTVTTFGASIGTISINCTKGLTYTVGLGTGENAASNGRRQMVNAGQYLQYDLYNSSVVWKSASNRVSGTLSDGVTLQQFPVTARIYTDQLTPPIGIYKDNVIIDVRY